MIVEDTEYNSSTNKNDWFLRSEENKIVNFHCNSTILLCGDKVLHVFFISKVQNMFEESYQGFHLDIRACTKTECILKIRKNDVESLMISEDWKLATEKMGEIKEVHTLMIYIIS